MEKQDIIDYVMETPGNSNPAVVGSMADELLKDSSISDIALDLDTNVGGDPIINLEYKEGETTYNSPVAFDKNDFEISNNHLKTKVLPDRTVEDEGKVLTVASDGSIEWNTAGGGVGSADTNWT